MITIPAPYCAVPNFAAACSESLLAKLITDKNLIGCTHRYGKSKPSCQRYAWIIIAIQNYLTNSRYQHADFGDWNVRSKIAIVGNDLTCQKYLRVTSTSQKKPWKCCTDEWPEAVCAAWPKRFPRLFHLRSFGTIPSGTASFLRESLIATETTKQFESILWEIYQLTTHKTLGYLAKHYRDSLGLPGCELHPSPHQSSLLHSSSIGRNELADNLE